MWRPGDPPGSNNQCQATGRKNVKLRQGDMWLCDQCEIARFGSKVKIVQNNAAATLDEELINGLALAQHELNDFIIHHVLAYISYSLDLDTNANTKHPRRKI